MKKILISTLMLLMTGNVFASSDAGALRNLANQLRPFSRQAGRLQSNHDSCTVAYEDAGRLGKFFYIVDSDIRQRKIAFSFDGPNEAGHSVEQISDTTWSLATNEPGDCVDPEYDDPQCRGAKSLETISVSENAVTITREGISQSCVF